MITVPQWLRTRERKAHCIMPFNRAWSGGGSGNSSSVQGGSTLMCAWTEQRDIRCSCFMKCGLNRTDLAEKEVGALHSPLKVF